MTKEEIQQFVELETSVKIIFKDKQPDFTGKFLFDYHLQQTNKWKMVSNINAAEYQSEKNENNYL